MRLCGQVPQTNRPYVTLLDYGNVHSFKNPRYIIEQSGALCSYGLLSHKNRDAAVLQQMAGVEDKETLK